MLSGLAADEKGQTSTRVELNVLRLRYPQQSSSSLGFQSNADPMCAFKAKYDVYASVLQTLADRLCCGNVGTHCSLLVNVVLALHVW